MNKPVSPPLADRPSPAPAMAARRLEGVTQSFVDGLEGSTPISKLTPEEARAVLANAQGSVAVAAPDVQVFDRTLAIGPTGATRIRVFRPRDAAAALPAVVYVHGGGWVLGDAGTHDRLMRELAAGAGAAVVFVDYERSPESRFPVAIEQAYAVLQHVAGRAAEIDIDAGRIAIAGDSVGGNMAAVVALMAKERNGPAIVAQLLFYPVTDASMSSGSYEEFADGPWLTRSNMAWFWDQYLPDVAARSGVHASPLNAAIADLAGLPQALVIVDENDVLRDEGEAYARKLAEAGVRVTSLRYNGTIHDFMMLNALAATPAVRAAVGQANGYLRYVFSAR